jgi:hypothetical protein
VEGIEFWEFLKICAVSNMLNLPPRLRDVTNVPHRQKSLIPYPLAKQ